MSLICALRGLGADDLLDRYTSAILEGEDPSLALGLHDYEDELNFDDIEARLEGLRGELEDLDSMREHGDDWLVAMNNETVVPFQKEQFQRSYGYLEAGNTVQFIASLDGLDVNMQDPEDKNTCVHNTP